MESSFIIDFLDPQKENHEEAVKWMEENSDQPLATTTICAYEFLRGAARINQDKEHVEDFLRALTIPSFDFESSVKAAETDAELHSQGNTLSARDTLMIKPSCQKISGVWKQTKKSDYSCFSISSIISRKFFASKISISS